MHKLVADEKRKAERIALRASLLIVFLSFPPIAVIKGIALIRSPRIRPNNENMFF